MTALTFRSDEVLDWIMVANNFVVTLILFCVHTNDARNADSQFALNDAKAG